MHGRIPGVMIATFLAATVVGTALWWLWVGVTTR